MLDAIINLVLGALLLAFPLGVDELLGVPGAETSFYPTILGGVIFGIGVALLIECFRRQGGALGLGTGGAIAINFCGSAVLVAWLVFGGLDIPPRGTIFLWCLCAIVFGTGVAEIVIQAGKQGDSKRGRGE